MLLQPDATGTLVTVGGLTPQARVSSCRHAPGLLTLHYLSRDSLALSLWLGPPGADMLRAKPGARLPPLLLLALALSLCTFLRGGPGVIQDRASRMRSRICGFSSLCPGPAGLLASRGPQVSPGPSRSFALNLLCLKEFLLGPEKALA